VVASARPEFKPQSQRERERERKKEEGRGGLQASKHKVIIRRQELRLSWSHQYTLYRCIMLYSINSHSRSMLTRMLLNI
jgi:hypothetical protein